METLSTSDKRKEALNRLYRKLIQYAGVMLFLTFVNYLTSPHYWWVIWPAAGWGLGIILQTSNLLFIKKE